MQMTMRTTAGCLAIVLPASLLVGCGVTGTEDAASQEQTQASDRDGGEADTQDAPSHEVVSETGEIQAYAVKTGTEGEAMLPSPGTCVIDNAQAWDDIVQAIDKSVPPARAEGLKKYDQAFFDGGNRVLVRYESLSTGSAEPSVTAWDVDEDGVLVVRWDDGLVPFGTVADGESGFVAVAEVPAGTDIMDMRLQFDIGPGNDRINELKEPQGDQGEGESE